MKRLTDWFGCHPRVAVAFSGGCDSALLLHAAVHSGVDVLACMVQSQFQPTRDREEALQLAHTLGVPLEILPCDVLEHTDIRNNPPQRCYHCKKVMFGVLTAHASALGYDCIVDGSNASDNPDDRPGMQALTELGVRSPLRECQLTKAEIRTLSRAAGLATWNKPANACLATRIPTGKTITQEDLCRIDHAENLLHGLGFSDLRVRLWHNAARIQVPPEQQTGIVAQRQQILAALSPLFDAVLLDLAAR